MNDLKWIKKRKSVRKYDSNLKLSSEELRKIEQAFLQFEPLNPDIKVNYRIVKTEETSCAFGEYCFLLYSETKEDSLLNAGYLLQQLDLYFVSQNIGSCWYGMAKPEEKTWNGLDFVIMMAFGKVEESVFRTSLNEFKRHPYEKMVKGVAWKSALSLSLLAPSAVNSQPWRIETSAQKIKVYRTSSLIFKAAKSLVDYYNRIDMGIYLYILEACLKSEHILYERELVREKAEDKMKLNACYKIEGKGD